MKQAADEHKQTNAASALKAWLDGRLRRPEEAALEQSAQSDPFLAEALEGYRSLPETDHNEYLAAVRRRLNHKKQRSALLVWRYAAAAAALVGVGILGWWMLTPNGNLSDMTAALESPSDPLAAEAFTTSDTLAPIAMLEEEAAESSATAAPERREAPAESTQQRYKETAEKPNFYSPPARALTESAPPPPPPPSPPTVATAPPTTEAAPARDEAVSFLQATDRITGRVLNKQGDPISGVTITANHSGDPVKTDAEGKFQIELDEKDRSLEVARAGYTTEVVPFGNSRDLNIVLEPDQPPADVAVADELLQEVPLQSSREAKKKTDAPAGSAAPAPAVLPPASDQQQFNTYIRKQLRYPEAATQNGIQGEVVLGWTLDEKGRPTDIRVLQSLGYGCDEEAIRLLKSAPRWTGAAGQYYRYSIPFRLK